MNNVGIRRGWSGRLALAALIAVGWAAVVGATALLAQPPAGAAERSAQLRAGTCGQLEATALFDLGMVGVGRSDDEDGDRDDLPAGDFVGAAGAIPVSVSAIEIPTTLDDLLAQPHSVVVTAGAADDPVVACGEIGGYQRDREELFIGLLPQTEAVVSGVAFIEEDDGRDVEVTLYLVDGDAGSAGTPAT